MILERLPPVPECVPLTVSPVPKRTSGKQSTRRGHGVGRTRQLSGAFEHSGAILVPTRVSPYSPAAGDMPQSMRPDTRQHLTACTNRSKVKCACKALALLEGVYLPHGRPWPSSRCAAPPLPCGPAGDRRGRPSKKPLRASPKAGPRSTGSKRETQAACSGRPEGEFKEGLQSERRPHTNSSPGAIRTR